MPKSIDFLEGEVKQAAKSVFDELIEGRIAGPRHEASSLNFINKAAHFLQAIRRQKWATEGLPRPE